MALEGFRTDENLGGKTEKIKREERKNPVAGNWVLGLLT
jgi:hypothetical protein